MNNTKKEKSPSARGSVWDLAVVIVFCAVIAVSGVLTFALPSREISENENRSLTTLSDLFSGSFSDKLFSGAFAKQTGDLCRDQFVFREKMLELRSLADAVLVRYETNGIIYGAEGYLVPRKDHVDTVYAEGNTAAINALGSALEKQGAEVVFAVAPRPCDVLQKYYPSGYNDKSSSISKETVLTLGGGLDLSVPIKAAADKGEYVYYKTDHHWTGYGAYLAYAEVMKTFGETPIPLENFEKETASTEFYGTSYSTAMYPFAEADVIEYYHYDDGGKYITEVVNTDIRLDGFYDRSYLDKKDKYSSYISGNNALVKVYKEGEKRPVMLLVKDSYAHSVVPFLALHYDLVIIDPRYYKASAYELALECGAEKMLVLCGIDTLTDANSFLVLNFGLPRE